MTSKIMNRHDLLTFISETCHSMYLEHGHTHEIAPMCFAEFPGKGLTIGVLAIDKEDIHAVFASLVEAGAITVGHLTEAWAARATAPNTADRKAAARRMTERVKAAGGVSKLPPDDRQEQLVIATADPGGLSMGMREIRRTPGRPVELGTLIRTSDAQSRMLDDLPWTINNN